MTKIVAVTDKIVDVDLTSGKVRTVDISASDRKQYIGGKGLALKLLYDHIETGVDPLSADNILVIMSGPATGTAAPAGGRFAVVSKSPLTGIFASSYTGNPAQCYEIRALWDHAGSKLQPVNSGKHKCHQW